MSLAPVVIFVYNRPDHFIQTFEALCKCPEVGQSDLFIFSDGAKSEKDVAKVQEVRDAVRSAMRNCAFRNVEIRESGENRGLAASVIAGVTEIVEKYGKVIVVEDDCMPSPYFLNYMNQCLNYYKDDFMIGSVAGFTPVLPFPKNFTDDVFLAYRSCSWGWATWVDRWQKVDWKLEHVQDFYKNPSLIRKLNANGNERFMRLYRQTKGNGSSWSVRFGAHLVKNNQFTVYPRYSYIQNIGCDASGVHSKEDDAIKMRVDLSKAIENPKLYKLKMNRQIQKVMKKHYSAGIISDVKRNVGTMLVVLKEYIMGGLWK